MEVQMCKRARVNTIVSVTMQHKFINYIKFIIHSFICSLSPKPCMFFFVFLIRKSK